MKGRVAYKFEFYLVEYLKSTNIEELSNMIYYSYSYNLKNDYIWTLYNIKFIEYIENFTVSDILRICIIFIEENVELNNDFWELVF